MFKYYFFKASPIMIELPLPTVKLPREVKHKFMEHYKSSSHGKNERFVPICHIFHVTGHIRPKCFKLMEYIRKLFHLSYLHMMNLYMLLNLNLILKIIVLDQLGLGNLN